MDVDEVTRRIIGAAIEVHRVLGPGLLESVYEECLYYELGQSGLALKRQLDLPVQYKNVRLNAGYRVDLLVDNQVVVELKAIDKWRSIHEAQILTYMRLLNCQVGLLINFNVPILKQGIKRKVLKYSNDKISQNQ